MGSVCLLYYKSTQNLLDVSDKSPRKHDFNVILCNTRNYTCETCDLGRSIAASECLG